MRKVLVAAGLAVLALLVGATAGTAQIASLYYQEVEKDGRIYVFNTPERYASWSASGEIGTAITLIGKAEGGKTLVAENETAADLYLFKHDLPGFDRPTPKPEKKFDERVYWKDGKTTFETKQAKIAISNRAQLRYSYFDAADDAIEDRGTILLATGVDGDEAWVSVADSGCGIPEDVQARIFDPFYTTKPIGRGTGLGLAIAYRIVAKHHGRIELNSRPGAGSTFRVVLPVRQPAGDAIPASPAL